MSSYILDNLTYIDIYYTNKGRTLHIPAEKEYAQRDMEGFLEVFYLVGYIWSFYLRLALFDYLGTLIQHVFFLSLIILQI